MGVGVGVGEMWDVVGEKCGIMTVGEMWDAV